MINRSIFCFMACLLLAGSILLPLGDFSLMRDIPDMYGNYSKVTTPEELGVIDFIGDYLLHGKDIFGHNKQDKQQSGANDVQFQHQAIPLNILIPAPPISFLAFLKCRKAYRPLAQLFLASGHLKTLFRPPLA